MSKINFAMFLAGATVGAAGAWFYCKRYYEQIAQEEIDSVKATFAERKPDALKNAKNFEDGTDDNKQKANMAKLKPDLVDYAAKLQAEGYTNYSSHSEKNNNKEAETVIDKPYVISPDEYGDCDYTTISLTYYSDGVLADDEDEIVENVHAFVGFVAVDSYARTITFCESINIEKFNAKYALNAFAHFVAPAFRTDYTFLEFYVVFQATCFNLFCKQKGV